MGGAIQIHEATRSTTATVLRGAREHTHTHTGGSDTPFQFRKAVSECKRGDFNTPTIDAIRQKIAAKEWGKTQELASWRQVIQRHGATVSYEALRLGTLPYVPHSLLVPSHTVKWPESHEFLMERKYWKQRWRDEISFETDSEQKVTNTAIDE